nr:hypothetical protein [Aliikangiella sp. G2MR2-5]
MGASTLAALNVPTEKIDEISTLVNSFREVNHNYLRENAFNLWFVVTAATEGKLQEILSEIQRRSECELLDLPMVKSYHIDLAFQI